MESIFSEIRESFRTPPILVTSHLSRSGKARKKKGKKTMCLMGEIHSTDGHEMMSKPLPRDFSLLTKILCDPYRYPQPSLKP